MTSSLSSQLSTTTRSRFLWAGGVSLLAWIALSILAPGGAIPWTPEMRAAAGSMESALEDVSRFCRDSGIDVDPRVDPNQTCMVGPDHSELFTSLGQVEAKRTTLSPDVAGLLVHLLSQVGVREGDPVAVGASGSFPGLLMATLLAVEALGARPVSILSMGASSYGATRPDFHLLTLHRLLEREGYVPAPPAAVSLGGAGDVGREFDPPFRERLVDELEATGNVVLSVAELEVNVAERMALYGREAAGKLPAAFVNIGGGEANLGISPLVLNLAPGLVEGAGGGDLGDSSSTTGLPSPSERGVLFEMISRGVPAIHLLHVRGLALRYGLPWDPLPLPEAGSTALVDRHQGKGVLFWFLTAIYFLSLSFIGFGRKTMR